MNSLTKKLDPSRTGLLVIDMQNDFCSEGGYLHQKFGRDTSKNLPLAKRIMKTVKVARKAGVTVIWIKANYEPRYLSQAMKANVDSNLICCEGGTWGWDFFHVLPTKNEPIIEKHSYNAFFETNLHEVLGDKNIETLVFTGVATNVCVESTLRDGYFKGYFVVMPDDLVAASTPEFQHGTISNVRHYFGDVPKAAEVEAIWST